MSRELQRKITVPRGAVIVREGEVDEVAYGVLTGSVAVYKESGGKQVILARLGPGQFFGEMSFILDEPRSASVVALEDCTLSVISRDGFNELLASDPRRVFPMLKVLFERLRLMNVRYAALETQLAALQATAAAAGLDPAPASAATQPPTTIPAARALTLEPGSVQTRALIGDGLRITKLPFRFGRRPSVVTDDVFDFNDLHVPDAPPYVVSRNHCALVVDGAARYRLQDRGSTLGTLVNGVRVGGGATLDEVGLDEPRSTLILGHPKSPWRFVLTQPAGPATG